MDDGMELMLGVRALNHVGRPALLHQPAQPRHLWLTTRIRWFKNDGDFALVAYDVTICEDGIIF